VIEVATAVSAADSTLEPRVAGRGEVGRASQEILRMPI
jgi:hypothetical protein